jgi:DNA-binding NarL/FixJ family response regulator
MSTFTAADAFSELACLTDRQREVLVLRCKGYTTRAVAERMGVTTRTVETHSARAKRVTGLTFGEQAVLAAKAGWV